jgi:homocysteine S-methyltransferase
MSFAQLAELCSAPIALSLKDGETLPLLLLDGGMGTCLELFGHNIADSPLWSASVIEKEATAIVRAHLAYLEAGADIIITNTYV